MLRTVVEKKKVIIFVILVCLLAALATIWPMRLYRENYTFSSGLDPVMASGAVDADVDAGEYFIAQYDHLQILEFYVDSVMKPGQADVQLFHVGKNHAMELVAEEVVDLPQETPGFAVVSTDADLIPGDQYVYTVHAAKDTDPGWNIRTGASFSVYYESADDAASTGKAPLYQLGFYNDSGIDGVALKTRLTYRVALSKGPSAALGLLYTGIAAAAVLAVLLYYHRKPERNTLLTVLRGMQYVLTPVVIAVSGLAFAAVWPLRLFDSRPLDILIYEAGILLGAGICLYGLWHDRSRETDLVNGELARRNLWHYGIIICIALIMNFSADYMNAVNDHLHDASMHRIVAMICLIVLFMGDNASNFNVTTASVTVVSIILGLIYYNLHRLPGTDSETVQTNAVFRTRAFACVMAAIAVTSVICMLTDRIRSRRKPETGVRKWIVIPLCILAGMLLIFRNTRLWIPLLIGVWLLFYVRYRYWKGRDRFLQDLCEGVVLDFIVKVIYSMLHRYYMAYLYSRFSMHFHTPTVTAYYLCIVGAAALTLFLKKWEEAGHMAGERADDPGSGPAAEQETGRKTAGQSAGSDRSKEVTARKILRRQRLAHVWKEAVLLGFVESYMVMSLTRAGIAVLAVLVLAGAVYLGHKERTVWRQSLLAGFRKALSVIGMALLLLVFLFPVAFTGQRIISTVYAHPKRFEELEPYDDRLLRNVDWNSTRFMNVEIFIRDFGDRIIGGDIGSKLYYGRGWEIPQGYRTSRLPQEMTDPYEEEGLVATEGNALTELSVLASAEDDPADPAASALPEEIGADTDGTDGGSSENMQYGSIETGDVSNGRTWLYHVYLQNLNLTGHDVMGVDLGNGEMAMHAHNIILQTAFDCGIPTGIVFAIVLVLMLTGTAQYAGVAGRRGLDGYQLLPFLLVFGFCMVGMVEWIFHFSNPYTIAVLFAMAPVLFPDKE